MSSIFVLIRAPFYAVGIILLVLLGIVALEIGLLVGGVILFLGVPLWLLVLFPGSIVVAAFSNDLNVIASFLRWTQDEIIGGAVSWLREYGTYYLQCYRDLGKWLVGAK